MRPYREVIMKSEYIFCVWEDALVLVNLFCAFILRKLILFFRTILRFDFYVKFLRFFFFHSALSVSAARVSASITTPLTWCLRSSAIQSSLRVPVSIQVKSPAVSSICILESLPHIEPVLPESGICSLYLYILFGHCLFAYSHYTTF